MGAFQTAIEPTFPDLKMLNSSAYFSSKAALIKTSFIPSGECSCNQFTFLIPLRQTLAIKTSGKLSHLTTYSVFPCNPYQQHSIVNPEIDDFEAYVLYLEEKHFKETMELLFGSGSVEMENSAFDFSQDLQRFVSAFIKEFDAMQPGYDLMLQSLAFQAAVTILREGRHNLSTRDIQQKEFCDVNGMKKAADFLFENYQANITLQELAAVTNYSPFHFLRLFKTHYGRTPFEYLLDLKINKAKHLLRFKDDTIAHICELSGFTSCSYFTQVFKKKTGLTPSQYKAQAGR